MPDLHVSVKDWVNFCLMVSIVSNVENVVIRIHFDPKFLLWERNFKGLRRPLDSITVPQCSPQRVIQRAGNLGLSPGNQRRLGPSLHTRLRRWLT